MTVELLDPKELDEYKVAAARIEDAVEESKGAVEVTDDASEERATDIVAVAKDALKTAEANRKAAKKPHEDQGKAIDAAFKEMWSPLEGVVKSLSAQVIERRRREQERVAEEQRAEQKRIDDERKRLEENARQRQAEEDKRAAAEKREAVEQKPFEIPDAPPPPPPPKTKTTSSGSRATVKENWKHEVVDLIEVPDGYCKTVADDFAIKTAIKNGVREIPGVRIYDDAVLAS